MPLYAFGKGLNPNTWTNTRAGNLDYLSQLHTLRAKAIKVQAKDLKYDATTDVGTVTQNNTNIAIVAGANANNYAYIHFTPQYQKSASVIYLKIQFKSSVDLADTNYNAIIGFEGNYTISNPSCALQSPNGSANVYPVAIDASGTETGTDIGGSYTWTEYNTLEIVIVPGDQTASFYMNGSLLETLSTNVPNAEGTEAIVSAQNKGGNFTLTIKDIAWWSE